MNDLNEPQVNLLKHIHGGGLIAVATYGKKELSIEVLSLPRSFFGLKCISDLQERGLVRYGDPSPYKSGRSLPIVLTDAGRVAAGV